MGSVIEGQLTGDGIMFFHNGDKYDGQWLEGQFHGRGSLVYSNGDTFKGFFKQGKRHGKGLHIRRKEGDTLGDGDWGYMYDGDYVEDMRQGYGVLKTLKPPDDNEGVRYIEYQGAWEGDTFHGKGRLQVYDSQTRQFLFEEHDGSFVRGQRDGLGRSRKLKDAEQYGDDEEFRRELLQQEMLEYVDFVGDFRRDKPVYVTGVLKTVRVPREREREP